MFLEPIRDGLMRTLETAGVDGVAVGTRRAARVKPPGFCCAYSQQVKNVMFLEAGSRFVLIYRVSCQTRCEILQDSVDLHLFKPVL